MTSPPPPPFSGLSGVNSGRITPLSPLNAATTDRRLAAALRAHATGVGGGVAVRHHAVRRGGGLPGWVVLALAVLLGALAGGVAGVISIW
ncbi:MAG: hypothetical protein ACRDSR_13595 [Pseudonocardiaceae bacterium]